MFIAHNCCFNGIPIIAISYPNIHKIKINLNNIDININLPINVCNISSLFCTLLGSLIVKINDYVHKSGVNTVFDEAIRVVLRGS